MHFLPLKVFITVGFICLSLASYGQFIVKGRVTDASNSDPIPFAGVVLKGKNIGTSTDFEGYFTLKTAMLTDSLWASFMGYAVKTKPLKKNLKEQIINFQLTPTNVSLNEVVIKAGENPAWKIMRGIMSKKDTYNKTSLIAYEHESYSKIELDVDNISEKLKNKKIIGKVIQEIEKLQRIQGEDGKTILPVFFSESVSNFYYRKNPATSKEVVLKTNVQGVGVQEGSVVSQMIGSTFQQYNFYNNWLSILGKDFMSPIADGWKGSYEYFLADTVWVGDYACYEIEFEPKRKQDLAFTGKMWVDSASFALVQIDAKVGKEANLNFIEKIKVQQELIPTSESAWIPNKTRVLVDISQLSENTAGMLAKFSTSNRNIVVNKPQESKFYDEAIAYSEESRDPDPSYWANARHDSLSSSEKQVYAMIDSIKKIPVVKTYVEIADVLINGYYKMGKIDIGPYLFVYANNVIEGNRVRMGFRTNEGFHKNWQIKGYAAYGTRDGILKYSAELLHIISRKPWTTAGFRKSYDLERVGLSSDDIGGNQLLMAFSRFNQVKNSYFQDEYYGYIQSELFRGFTQTIALRNRSFDPVHDFYKFAYRTEPELGDQSPLARNFINTELVLESRFAPNETYINSGLRRRKLPSKVITSWLPNITLRYTKGMKDVLGGGFDYHKMLLTISKNFRVGILGRSNLAVTGGYISSELGGSTPPTIPYPLLQAHLGNEAVFYVDPAYNLMNTLEFVSDRWVAIKYNHDFEGLFFNRIPLIKKLKWRFGTNAKLLWGDVSKANFELTPYTHRKFGNLNQGAYIEVGYGISNILKFIKVEAIHRLTYLNNPETKRFGIKVSAQFRL